MGIAAKIMNLVSPHKANEVDEKKDKNPQAETHAPEGSLPEFLDEESLGAAAWEKTAEEAELENHQWRPRPLGDDLPLSG